MRKIAGILFMLVFTFGVTSNALAEEESDFSFKGEIFLYSFYSTFEQDGMDDNNDFLFGDINQRSQFTVLYEKGPVEAKVEMRKEGFASYYATYNFGAWKLMMGRDDFETPTCNLIDWDWVGGWAGVSLGHGADRRFFAKGIVPIGSATLELAAVEPYIGEPLLGGDSADTDTSMPAIEGKVSVPAGPVVLDLWGGYKTYTEVSVTDDEYDIDQNIIGFNATFEKGPFLLQGTVWQSHNGYNDTGYYVNRAAHYYDPAEDEIVDSDNLGYSAWAHYAFSDKIGLAAGYGKEHQENDNDVEDDGQGYCIIADIMLTPNLIMYPEFSVDDFEDSDGKNTFVGVTWRLIFGI